MSLNFPVFAQNVHDQYKAMALDELFVVDVLPDTAWATYLGAFPAGTDPIFRTNTEHTCSCCRNFIKHLGLTVAIKDGKLATVWDDYGQLPEPYRTVGKAMHDLVSNANISRIFRSKELRYGLHQNVERMEDGTKLYWHHFHGDVATRHMSTSPGKDIGSADSRASVFARGLVELNEDDISTVLELTDQKALYRGEEHRTALLNFLALKVAFKGLDDRQKHLYVWRNYANPFAQIRNTVIGTLLIDLAEGMNIEQAVKSFEQKVAPANYKRPTALVTTSMINSAIDKIRELGLEPSLERRLATLSDLSINDVLWVSGSARGKMKDNLSMLGDMLKSSAAMKIPTQASAEEITAYNFLANIVPKAEHMELFVENRHTSNFMSLTTAAHNDAPLLFKWGNPFAWSYSGDVTDSIRERVKAAGGNVDAKMRISLSWFNLDDLDLHVKTPRSEYIYYANKVALSGSLDVDMNAFGARSRTPVENVALTRIYDGVYTVQINQYCRRETVDVGFVIEVECDGVLQQFKHVKAVSGTVDALKITVVNGKITGIISGTGVTPGDASMQHWGIETQRFVPVSTLMYSPNYWGENAVGNRHWFFLVEGCKTPTPVRGIYNEYLRSDLERDHRKVFELVGNRTKCAPSADQLSGLGFSSTRNDKVIARVTNAKSMKTYSINF